MEGVGFKWAKTTDGWAILTFFSPDDLTNYEN